MPLRFALSARVLHDDPHPAITIFVHRSTQDPDTRIFHLHDGVNSFGRPELEHFNLTRPRNGVAVQRDDIEFVTWQGQFDGLCGAGVQDAKHDSLTFLDPYWITGSEASSIDGKSLVADFPSVGFLSLIVVYFGFQSWILWLGALLFHLTGAVERFKLVRGQKHFLIIATGLVIGLDVNDSELSRVQPAKQVASGHHMGMYPTNPGRPGSELVADLPTGRHHNAFFFAGSVDFRRDELSMPMDELRGVRIVKHLYRNLLALV